MTARKAQFRAFAQTVDTDADGFISKEEMRVFNGAWEHEDILEYLNMMSEVEERWGQLLKVSDTNHDEKVRWPLRGHAALAESGAMCPGQRASVG